MKPINYIVFFIFIFIQISCLRLDSNLYNLSEKITEYKYDNYTGLSDFRLDASYKIHDSMIHLFTLDSKGVKDTRSFKIYAIYLGDINRIETDTVIMYCHGNKWHMDFYWQRAKLLAHVGSKHRFGVLMLDYRGFGLSEGPPTEDGLYADVTACLQWLKQKGLSNERLMMYGFSMGSAAATMLTANPAVLVPNKLLLEAPFASAAVMAADAAGLNLPGSYVTNLKINNAEEIKKVSQPLFWIHGVNDNFLNIKTHGEVVFKNYGGSYKEAYRIEGADHGQIPAVFGFINYTHAIGKFLMK
ncbi:MAG: alpha/beta hydrolase [Bacteroidota bacterium]|nr:alpha/beta hydrolase [Bacteroidota bacterium]